MSVLETQSSTQQIAGDALDSDLSPERLIQIFLSPYYRY